MTKNWVEINDDLRGTYNTKSQIKFKTPILKSSLCDYSDAYILVKGNIAAVGAGATDGDRAAIEVEIINNQYLTIVVHRLLSV